MKLISQIYINLLLRLLLVYFLAYIDDKKYETKQKTSIGKSYISFNESSNFIISIPDMSIGKEIELTIHSVSLTNKIKTIGKAKVNITSYCKDASQSKMISEKLRLQIHGSSNAFLEVILLISSKFLTAQNGNENKNESEISPKMNTSKGKNVARISLIQHINASTIEEIQEDQKQANNDIIADINTTINEYKNLGVTKKDNETPQVKSILKSKGTPVQYILILSKKKLMFNN